MHTIIPLEGDVSINQFPRIVHNTTIMGGKACVVGTRITVGMILVHISEGATHDEILAEYPHLTKDDIVEVIRYAAWVVGATEDLVVL